MRKIDTLLYPTWIVPIKPHNVILENHALAIDKGKIVDILSDVDAKDRYTASETLILEDHVVLPGFVNAHTHSPLTMMRGIANDLPLMDWLNDYVWPAEKKWLSDQFVYDATMLSIAEMIKCGTTCFNEHYFFPASIAKAVLETGIRACIAPTIIGFPNPWSQNSNEAITKTRQFHQDYSGHPLLSLAIGPHAPYTLSDEDLLAVKKFAEKLHCPVHLHLLETATEVKESLRNYHLTPVERLDKLGLLSPDLQAIHMTQVDDDDMTILSKNKALNIVHCPDSNLKLASGFCPIQKLIVNGFNVAIGTDSALSNNDLDMIGEMKTAAFLAKNLNGDPTVVPAAYALQMGTLNGAKVMGLESEVGTLEVGKSADVIAVDFLNLSTQPGYNPISGLIYSAAKEQVKYVWVQGRKLLDKGSLVTIDENELMAKVKIMGKKIKEDLPRKKY